MNSTPIISARIIRLTALLPPPPTPMTRMSAKFSESERNGIGLSSRPERAVRDVTWSTWTARHPDAAPFPEVPRSIAPTTGGRAVRTARDAWPHGRAGGADAPPH